MRNPRFRATEQQNSSPQMQMSELWTLDGTNEDKTATRQLLVDVDLICDCEKIFPLFQR